MTTKTKLLLTCLALSATSVWAEGATMCTGYDTTNGLMVNVAVAEPDANTREITLSQKKYRQADYTDLFILKNGSKKSIQTYRNQPTSLIVVAAHHKSSVTLVADLGLFGGDASNPEETYILGELSYTYGAEDGSMKKGRATVRCEYSM